MVPWRVSLMRVCPLVALVGGSIIGGSTVYRSSCVITLIIIITSIVFFRKIKNSIIGNKKRKNAFMMLGVIPRYFTSSLY